MFLMFVFDVSQPSFIPSHQDIKIHISPGKKENKVFEDLWFTFFGGPFTGAWKAPNEPTQNALKIL